MAGGRTHASWATASVQETAMCATAIGACRAATADRSVEPLLLLAMALGAALSSPPPIKMPRTHADHRRVAQSLNNNHRGHEDDRLCRRTPSHVTRMFGSSVLLVACARTHADQWPSPRSRPRLVSLPVPLSPPSSTAIKRLLLLHSFLRLKSDRRSPLIFFLVARPTAIDARS